eukprot:CAMPEP_0194574046 /NCGR_PEP_ID=MMETSP0292-20121207/10054_1 /TAXON_ID=39354 /ORGANISM="Heterosigma akashiwo, Strain CCMP2393" /LENGTH=80 /DNA_ID=CAMNT_0039425489 /DNA_START=50 /DNA_END=292 /DNA_ORIENTATION=+
MSSTKNPAPTNTGVRNLPSLIFMGQQQFVEGRVTYPEFLQIRLASRGRSLDGTLQEGTLSRARHVSNIWESDEVEHGDSF